MSRQPTLGHLLRLAAWLIAYAVVAPLVWVSRSRRRSHLGIAGLAVIAVLQYFRQVEGGVLRPSALDHVAATKDFPASGRARVSGYCAVARCRPIEGRAPTDVDAVSDHCPVVLGGR